MKRRYWKAIGFVVAAQLLTPMLTGCSAYRNFANNHFKVGPNYVTPSAETSPDWIDSRDLGLPTTADDLSQWWTVFNDPVLDALICSAYEQNLTLMQAGTRVLQARAQLEISKGNLLPQAQSVSADYERTVLSAQTALNKLFIPFGAPRSFSQWDYAFNSSWEIDLWGRLRRAIESSEANLDASVNDYNNVLVTLLGDVATNYVQLRVLQQQIRYARQNIEIQEETLKIAEARYKAETITKVDVLQARSLVEQTKAQLPQLETSLRSANNQLCILLGMPPEELTKRLGPGSIPQAPAELGIGIPADLVRRRPDIRAAERKAAAQCAQIGIAESDLYPQISITGGLGYSAEEFGDVFSSPAFAGQVGPSFRWNILNFGRIHNNVKMQEAKFCELVLAYRSSVLNACLEVEQGLALYRQSQIAVEHQQASTDQIYEAVELVVKQFQAGKVDFTQLLQVQQTLIAQQMSLAQSQGEIATGLIQVYRSLGGGWQINCKK